MKPTRPELVNTDIEEASEIDNMCHALGKSNHVKLHGATHMTCGGDPTEVRQAIRAEMDFSTKMQVYKNLSRQKCCDPAGKKRFKARWIDPTKLDAKKPTMQIKAGPQVFKHGQALSCTTQGLPSILSAHHSVWKRLVGQSKDDERPCPTMLQAHMLSTLSSSYASRNM